MSLSFSPVAIMVSFTLSSMFSSMDIPKKMDASFLDGLADQLTSGVDSRRGSARRRPSPRRGLLRALDGQVQQWVCNGLSGGFQRTHLAAAATHGHQSAARM